MFNNWKKLKIYSIINNSMIWLTIKPKKQIII